MKLSNSGLPCGLLICATLVLPTRAAVDAPTVDSILDKYVEASGGKAAMEKIKSRIVKGEIDLLGATSDWQMSAKAPNKQISELNSATLGAIVDGFDGMVAWSKNQGGIRVKEGEELAKTKRDADFYRDVKFKTLYPDLAYKGTDKVDGEEVRVLESKPSASSKERFSFSTKSGLLIRQESELEGPQGKVMAAVRLDDFRAVDGVKYPFNLKFKINTGGQDFEFGIKVKEVKHNVAIEDAKFAKPAG
jgi:hypothetical protein